MYLINCDASIQPFNPGGIVAWAYLVRKNKVVIHKDCAVSVKGGPLATNNVGEYHAIIAALLWLIELPEKDQKIPVIIMSDSQLIINHLGGIWQCKEENLVPLYTLAKKATKRYKGKITFKWIPREKNSDADALSRSAYNPEDIQYFKDHKLDIIFDGDDLPF